MTKVQGVPSAAAQAPSAQTGADAINGPNAAQENASTPAEQRVIKKVRELDPGPKLGEKGEHLPAIYRTSRGHIRHDR